MMRCKLRGFSLLEIIIVIAISVCLTFYSISSFLPIKRRIILQNAADHLVLLLQHAKIVSLTEKSSVNFLIRNNRLGTWQVPKEINVTSNRSHLIFNYHSEGASGSAICLCLQQGKSIGREVILNRLARIRVANIICVEGRSEKCQ